MSNLTTKITEKMIINADGKDIVLNGLDFTDNGFLEIQNANSVVVKNCRVYKLNCEDSNRKSWLTASGMIPVQIKVINSFFGANPGTNGKMYNLFEAHATLKSKSSFSHNYFVNGACTHNTVNLYGAEEGASILVNGNYFGNADGALRIGVKGEPVCTIVAQNNEYNCPTESDWNNYVFIEPNAKTTSTFANMKIIASNNKFIGTGADPYLAWSGSDDTLLSRESSPKLTEDGKEVVIPIKYGSKVKEQFVAVIGTTGYATLTEAIAAANGKQITLMKSVDEDVDLTDVDLVGSIAGLTVNGVDVKF